MNLNVLVHRPSESYVGNPRRHGRLTREGRGLDEKSCLESEFAGDFLNRRPGPLSRQSSGRRHRASPADGYCSPATKTNDGSQHRRNLRQLVYQKASKVGSSVTRFWPISDLGSGSRMSAIGTGPEVIAVRPALRSAAL